MRKMDEEKLAEFKWIFDEKTERATEEKDGYIPPYGDVTELNSCRMIMDSVGKETLQEIGEYAISLLDTSVAVYEVNGDYAFGMFSSGWCRVMDAASWELCQTADNTEALSCGKWLCHENCWNDSAKKAILTGKSTDIECVGGIHLYAEPIYADQKVVGAINIGYGDPPKNPEQLKDLADRFGSDPQTLKALSDSYLPRPQYIVQMAKKFLKALAGLIGRIVEKSEAEIRIEESERNLRQAQALGKIGNWEFDVESKQITWSDEVFRLFERDPSQGPPDFDENMAYYHDEDSERLQKQFLAAVQGGVTTEDDYRVILPSGERVWRHGKIFRERDEKGKTVKLLGTVQDITDRKVLEESLEIERKRLVLLLEAFPGFIYLQAADYSIPFANQYFINNFGDPKNKPCYKTLWGRDEPCDPCHTFKLFETKKPLIWEWADAPNGKIYMIHDFPFIDVDGSEMVLEIGMDITGQKTAEMALQRERERLNVTLQSIGDGVITTDISGNVVMLNKVAESLTGWNQDEAKGKKLQEIFHIVDEHTRKRCHNPVQKVLKTKGIVALANDTILISRDGKERVIADSGAPIIDAENNTIGVVLVFRDITEKIALETELRQAHKMEAIGNLAGGIAHEFNNVLGIILGNAELAIDDVPDWNPAKESLMEIRKASFRAKEVVRQILSFARKTMSALKPLEINTVVRESLKLMRASIPAMVDIQPNIPFEPSMILGDPTEIHQIVINLCTNAAHAMKTSGGMLEVEISEVTLDRKSASVYEDLSPGDFVKMTVRDSGEGITPDILEKVYEPYFTTKEFGAGSGMGLAVVYGIVKKCKGAIKIDSTVGEGTTVNVLFPKIEEEARAEEKKEGELPTGNERILLVDDDPSLVTMIRQMLERLGYTVMSLSDSAAALEQFKSTPDDFDLVITDMAMPNMSGDQLAAELLKVKNDIPILLCTGHSDTIDEKKAKQIGIKGFAMKPLDKGRLAHAARAALDG